MDLITALNATLAEDMLGTILRHWKSPGGAQSAGADCRSCLCGSMPNALY